MDLAAIAHVTPEDDFRAFERAISLVESILEILKLPITHGNNEDVRAVATGELSLAKMIDRSDKFVDKTDEIAFKHACKTIMKNRGQLYTVDIVAILGFVTHTYNFELIEHYRDELVSFTELIELMSNDFEYLEFWWEEVYLKRLDEMELDFMTSIDDCLKELVSNEVTEDIPKKIDIPRDEADVLLDEFIQALDGKLDPNERKVIYLSRKNLPPEDAYNLISANNILKSKFN